MKPLRQSNFSTACIRPRLPSWIRSRSGSPEAWYFLAIDTTSRRFDCTKVRSASSPSRSRSTQLALLGRRELLAAVVELLVRRHAALDRLGEAHLVVLGEQRVLADVGQIEPNEVFLVALDIAPWATTVSLAWFGDFSGTLDGRYRRPAWNRAAGGALPTIPTRSRGPTGPTADRDAPVALREASARSPNVLRS